MTLAERCKKVMPPMGDRVTNLGIERGEGCYIYTDDGRKILDFGSGIAVCNLGHGYPSVIEAAKKQMEKLVHPCHNLVYYESYVKLAEKIVELTGGDNMVYFSNSGAEAVEGAIKLAKFVTQRPAIIAFKNSFHGRTYGAASITASNSQYRKHYEGMLPSIYFAEYPNLFRTPYKYDGEHCPKEYMTQFDEIFKKLVEPHSVAAIILEPVQGEGGYIVPPLEWLKYLRKICDEYGIMLVFDEVQTGVGRTGCLYASQTFGVEPDIFTSAKGLGNGFPISAVIGKKKYMKNWEKGAHGGTFGGNPVAYAAALQVLEEMTTGGVMDNCKVMGEYFRECLYKLEAKYSSVIGDVRGVGLMNAIELVGENNIPDAELASSIQHIALDKNLLLLICGAEHNVIRFIPPLIITKEQIDEAMIIIDESIAESIK